MNLMNIVRKPILVGGLLAGLAGAVGIADTALEDFKAYTQKQENQISNYTPNKFGKIYGYTLLMAAGLATAAIRALPKNTDCSRLLLDDHGPFRSPYMNPERD